MKTYLFSYPFQGGRFSLEMPAASEIEAKAKAEAIRRDLTYDGEVVLSIPVPGGNWLSRLFWR